MPERFVVDNAKLWIGDGAVRHGHVVVNDQQIESVGDGAYHGDLPVTDLQGRSLSPGLVDLMVLGGFGQSILRDNPLAVSRRCLPLGITSIQFSGGMLPWPDLQRLLTNIREAREQDKLRIMGMYLEGPFIVPALAGGALAKNAMAPTDEHVARFCEEFGDVFSMINVSPGLPNAASAIRRLRRAGKVVSMAHSCATAEEIDACLEAGTSVLGHCWNNNSGLLGDSGVPQPTIEHVALTDDRVRFIHMICDGVHVHPVLVRLVLRCRGIESICIVSDCNQQSGSPDGPFVHDDGQVFYKAGGVCRRSDNHGLAGSATFLPDMFRNFVRFTGLPPHQAIRAVTFNSAKSLDLDDRIGLLAPRRRADMVAWDDTLGICRIWSAGSEIEPASHAQEAR